MMGGFWNGTKYLGIYHITSDFLALPEAMWAILLHSLQCTVCWKQLSFPKPVVTFLLYLITVTAFYLRPLQKFHWEHHWYSCILWSKYLIQLVKFDIFDESSVNISDFYQLEETTGSSMCWRHTLHHQLHCQSTVIATTTSVKIIADAEGQKFAEQEIICLTEWNSLLDRVAYLTLSHTAFRLSPSLFCSGKWSVTKYFWWLC